MREFACEFVHEVEYRICMNLRKKLVMLRMPVQYSGGNYLIFKMAPANWSKSWCGTGETLTVDYCCKVYILPYIDLKCFAQMSCPQGNIWAVHRGQDLLQNPRGCLGVFVLGID